MEGSCAPPIPPARRPGPRAGALHSRGSSRAAGPGPPGAGAGGVLRAPRRRDRMVKYAPAPTAPVFGRKPRLREGVHVFSAVDRGGHCDFLFGIVTGVEGRRVGVNGVIVDPVGLRNKVSQGKAGERSEEVLRRPTPDNVVHALVYRIEHEDFAGELDLDSDRCDLIPPQVHSMLDGWVRDGRAARPPGAARRGEAGPEAADGHAGGQGAAAGALLCVQEPQDTQLSAGACIPGRRLRGTGAPCTRPGRPPGLGAKTY